VVDSIKGLSWRWFLGKISGESCLYYEWHMFPIDYICKGNRVGTNFVLLVLISIEI